MKEQHGRDLTGKEMAEMLDEFVNTNDKKKFADFIAQATQRTHRTLQQRIMFLFVGCIESWAKAEGGSDPRNEATVALCKKIVSATGDQYDRHLPYI